MSEPETCPVCGCATTVRRNGTTWAVYHDENDCLSTRLAAVTAERDEARAAVATFKLRVLELYSDLHPPGRDAACGVTITDANWGKLVLAGARLRELATDDFDAGKYVLLERWWMDRQTRDMAALMTELRHRAGLEALTAG